MVFGYSNEELTGQSRKDDRPTCAAGPMLTPSTTSWTKETKAVITHSHTSEGFSPSKVSSLEAQFHINDPSLDIPTLVGLPLWMRRHCWTGPHGDQRRPANDTENDAARALCVSGDAESGNFLTTPSLRGDWLFARKDGRDLLSYHLVCLKGFCDAVVKEFCRREAAKEKKEEEGNPRRSKRTAEAEARAVTREMGMRFRRLASREEFRRYWARWCGRKLAVTGMAEYSMLRDPYDM